MELAAKKLSDTLISRSDGLEGNGLQRDIVLLLPRLMPVTAVIELLAAWANALGGQARHGPHPLGGTRSTQLKILSLREVQYLGQICLQCIGLLAVSPTELPLTTDRLHILQGTL